MSIEDRLLPEFEAILRQITEASGLAFEFLDRSEYSRPLRLPLVQTAHAFTLPHASKPGVECVYIEDSHGLSPQNLTTTAAHEIAHFKLNAEGYRRLYSVADDPTENEFARMVSHLLADIMVDTYIIEMKLDPWNVISPDFANLLTAVRDGRWGTPYKDAHLDRSFRIVVTMYWLLHPGVPQSKKQQLIEALEEKFPDVATRASTLTRRISEIGLTCQKSYEKCLWLLTDRLWGNRRPFEIRPWRQ